MGEVCLPCRSLCRERLIFVPRFNSLGSLEVGQGKSLMNAPRTDSSAAKGNGLGAYFQKQWTFAPWPVSWIEQGLLDDITLLENFPILVSIYIWGDQLKNKKVLFRCDNKAVVEIINRQTSESSHIMVLV